MPTGRKLQPDFSITVDGTNIKPTSTVKLLSVTLDDGLTFKTHIDSTVLKCHGLLGTLAHAAPHLSSEASLYLTCSVTP